MKNILGLLGIFLAMDAFAASSSQWQTYSNSQCGYSFQYPQGSQIISPLDAQTIQSNFYADPMQYLTDSKVSINYACSVEVVLPKHQSQTNLDSKNFFVIMLDQAPAQWPLPKLYPNSTQKNVTIKGQT